MLKKLAALAIGIMILFGCAGTQKFDEERLTYPLVVVSKIDCSDISVFVGEWIDENRDMAFDESEWYIYVSERLGPMERQEFILPEGMYVIKVVKEKDGTTMWTVGTLPQPDLKPNEKSTLYIECQHEQGESHQCPNHDIEA
jgi:hypothetical protein